MTAGRGLLALISAGFNQGRQFSSLSRIRTPTLRLLQRFPTASGPVREAERRPPIPFGVWQAAKSSWGISPRSRCCVALRCLIGRGRISSREMDMKHVESAVNADCCQLRRAHMNRQECGMRGSFQLFNSLFLFSRRFLRSTNFMCIFSAILSYRSFSSLAFLRSLMA